MWNFPWWIADEIHKRAQFWLFDAVGRLKLKAEPFNLVPGEYVNVKIIAVNTYGESIFSEVGTGG